MTFGASIIVAVIVGIAIRAKVPSIKFSIILKGVTAPKMILKM